MYTFSYKEPKTLNDAVKLLQANNAVVLAGGTELIPRLRGMISPTHPDMVVNIKTITGAGLDQISISGNSYKIGALVKLTKLAENVIIKNGYNALAEAASQVGSPEIRNRATLGGNICQHVRCWYYRHEYNKFPCRRKEGAEKGPIKPLCYAYNGDNRYHSIFGNIQYCIAVNPSDIAPALVALDAEIITNNITTYSAESFFESGVRTVKKPTEIWVLPKENITKIKPNEIVSHILVTPPQMENIITKSKFVKFAPRKSIDFSIVSCAVRIIFNATNKKVKEARICLNGVYNYPYRSSFAESALKKGMEISETNANIVAQAAIGDPKLNILKHNKYKKYIVEAMIRKAILGCQP